MMGSENNHIQESSREQMEIPILNEDDGSNDDVSTSKSYSNYCSAMTTLSSSSEHPLLTPPSIATNPASSDPLLFPSHDPFPESPSYADVIISPLEDSPTVSSDGDGGSDDVHRKLRVSPRSQLEGSEYLRITVSDPKKEVESSNSFVPGGNSYVTYLITTNTNIHEYRGSDFRVRRRFRDVIMLADRLSEGYKGYFVPIRPDKSVMESQVMQKQEFVEQRRVALEKYLRRLVMHPVIKKSNELKEFLTVEGRMPSSARTDVASNLLDGMMALPKQLLGESRSVIESQDAVEPAKGRRDLLSLFKELKQSVVHDWGRSRPPVEEEDKELLEKKEKLHYLEQQLTNASKQAESLVKAQEDMGDTMGELGLAFIKLTKFENDHAILNTQRVRAADMKNVATAAVKASRLYRALNAQTVKHLDTLHEYMGLILSVHSAFSDRSSALSTIQTLTSELSSLHSRAAKHETTSSKNFGGDNSRIHKLEELKESIRVTEDAKRRAIRDYEQIKDNNRSEMKRLDSERQADFVNMLKGFVTNQVAYTERIGNEWAKVVEETSRYAKENA
ncbi:sorting nexin 2A-like [Olea europaea subsp. europaea]|uniref:Sorting nexin 2A-like n=1 Tax=Olea europaea subsp. europaea TaxID=158383 RepID=A0A8S0VH15_OLEEU|nr:sorting nexin 2A-like [Olea europaea subsp. europaea]